MLVGGGCDGVGDAERGLMVIELDGGGEAERANIGSVSSSEGCGVVGSRR